MKIRHFIPALLACAPLLATDPACVSGTQIYNGVSLTTVCAVAYDSMDTSGEGQRYLDIMYPTSMSGSNSSAPVVVFGLGVGYRNPNQEPWQRWANVTATTRYAQEVALHGGVAIMPYALSLASYGILNTAVTAGSSANLAVNLQFGGQYWPNLGGAQCSPVTACAYSYPYNVLLDSGGANPEVVTITAGTYSGSNIMTLTISGTYQFNHSTNVRVEIPKTQYPAPTCDVNSLFSWLGANLGQGTYPGNPNNLNLTGVSSSQDALMRVAGSASKSYWLNSTPSNSSWWDYSNATYSTSFPIGARCVSANTSTNWTVAGVYPISPVLDFQWVASNNVGSGQLGLIPVEAELGCDSSSSAHCQAFAATQSADNSTFAGGLFTNQVKALLQVGNDDYLTAICNPVTCSYPWTSGNQYATWQTHYNANGNNVVVWTNSSLAPTCCLHGLDMGVSTYGYTWTRIMAAIFSGGAHPSGSSGPAGWSSLFNFLHPEWFSHFLDFIV